MIAQANSTACCAIRLQFFFTISSRWCAEDFLWWNTVAATALGLIGKNAKPAIPALKLAATDVDQRVRTAAAQAVALIEQNETLRQFRKAIEALR